MAKRCEDDLNTYWKKHAKIRVEIMNMTKKLIVRYHVPVLATEVGDLLAIRSGNWYVDATAGGGGHCQVILERGGCVIALDQDSDAIDELKTRFNEQIGLGRVLVRQTNFRNVDQVVKELNKTENIAGVLFDLGTSTHQLKLSGRGFSFWQDEPLDMRMSQDAKITARDVVNTYSREALYEIIATYGEDRLARGLVDAIVRTRAVMPIETTRVLGEIADEVYKKKGVRERIHPATRLFQALRIEVNQELEVLKVGLEKSWGVLGSKGRLVVISFHSLEDRIVKQTFNTWSIREEGELVTKKPVRPTNDEIQVNSAARSAKLRVIEKNVKHNK